MQIIEARIRELGLVLPAMPTALASYVPFVVAGDLLFVSGQVPRSADGSVYSGKVGERISLDEANRHARQVGLQLLSLLKSALGSLDGMERVVKLTGFVNATPEFQDHAQVINGCSDLMIEVFGEGGRHARSSVGVNSLPKDAPIEIDAIFKIRR